MTAYNPQILFCDQCLTDISDDDLRFFYESICEFYVLTGSYIEILDRDCFRGSKIDILEKMGAILTSESSRLRIAAKPNGYEKKSEHEHKFCFQKH